MEPRSSEMSFLFCRVVGTSPATIRCARPSTTADLIHRIPEQIAAISGFTTLLPGDVILTGTPNASGHLDPGDEAIVRVEGIGSLRNVVVRG